MKNLFPFFCSFFRIGLFTFGGGPAMLPLLEKEMQAYSLSQDDVIKYFSLAQALPGVIAINTSTFVGYALFGIPGALIATLGVVLPSYFIIVIILTFFQAFFAHNFVQIFLGGARMAVVAMILSSITTTISRVLKQPLKPVLLFFSILLLSLTTLSLAINPIYLIMALLVYIFLYQIIFKKK
ncbi:MAG: chromate transporter [Spirochaetia bacterium]